MDRLLTTKELADYLSVSPETVRWWRKQARGPRATKVGKGVRYRESDVLAWIGQHSTSAAG